MPKEETELDKPTQTETPIALPAVLSPVDEAMIVAVRFAGFLLPCLVTPVIYKH
jgi:hypothetical protein